jgi:predicted nucleic acid-binding protein
MSAILQRAQVLNTNGIGKTIGLADCTLAAAAEVLHYTLVTCDNDLITKLLKENETNAGNFQLLPYTYETMEQDFKQWNE